MPAASRRARLVTLRRRSDALALCLGDLGFERPARPRLADGGVSEILERPADRVRGRGDRLVGGEQRLDVPRLLRHLASLSCLGACPPVGVDDFDRVPQILKLPSEISAPSGRSTVNRSPHRLHSISSITR